MTAHEQLTRLYEEWRCLSEGEAESIRAEAWPRLAGIQDHKADLQRQIIAASEPFETELARAQTAGRAVENPFRLVVQELILLETRNAEILADKRQAAERERAELDRSSQNLRLVQRSYGHPLGSAWHSYS